MSIIKIVKDYIIKKSLPRDSVPRGLFELDQYFRRNKEINFDFETKGDLVIATSNDFKLGSIITSGKNPKELDENIKDAILTSFKVPSSYSKEARIVSVKEISETSKVYALA